MQIIYPIPKYNKYKHKLYNTTNEKPPQRNSAYDPRI